MKEKKITFREEVKTKYAKENMTKYIKIEIIITTKLFDDQYIYIVTPMK